MPGRFGILNTALCGWENRFSLVTDWPVLPLNCYLLLRSCLGSRTAHLFTNGYMSVDCPFANPHLASDIPRAHPRHHVCGNGLGSLPRSRLPWSQRHLPRLEHTDRQRAVQATRSARRTPTVRIVPARLDVSVSAHYRLPPVRLRYFVLPISIGIGAGTHSR